MLVDSPNRSDDTGGIGDGHIDFLMDSIGLTAGIRRDNLGGTTRGRQQLGVDAQRGERLDEGRDQRGFARTGVAFQQESRAWVAIIEEASHGGTRIPLTTRRIVWKVG